jgi:hypothetical protein
MALSVPLSRFTSRVGGGSAFFVRRHSHITMKPKVTLTVSVVAALAVGFLAGKFQASSSWSELYTRYTYERDAGIAADNAEVLKSLRGGHEADGMNLLEQSLDLSLLSLDHFPRKQWTPPVSAAIIQVRAYRAKYPWDKTPPQIDESIQRVLK